MRDIHYRVASRWLNAAPSAMELLRELGELEELSDNLSEMEDAVAFNFKLAAMDTEVESQFDMLKKARSGVAKAKEIMKSAQEIAAMFPEDKTATRAVKDADVMLRRFERHEANAAAIIRRLSKKQAPPALIKAAKSLEGSLKRMMVDPKHLNVVPWQSTTRDYRTNRNGVLYKFVFKITDPEFKGGAYNSGGTIIVLSQSTLTKEGVLFSDTEDSFRDKKPFSLKDAKAMALENTQGWAGIKGEGEATAKRESVAKNIARTLEQVLGRWGDGLDEPEFRKGYRIVDVGVKAGYHRIPKDGAWGVDEYRYEQMVDETVAELQKVAERAVAAYKNDIKSVKAWNSGEKSWCSVEVELK